MPWIIDDVSDKVESALGMGHLTSLHIENLECKSWVANEFFDLMCSYDLPEQGLDKLKLNSFYQQCEPFEEEVLTRLASMCPNITHLQLSFMANLSEAGRLSMVTLLRQIVQRNPPISDLKMYKFSKNRDLNENIGELVLEILLNSSIDTITVLNFWGAPGWELSKSTKTSSRMPSMSLNIYVF